MRDLVRGFDQHGQVSAVLAAGMEELCSPKASSDRNVLRDSPSDSLYPSLGYDQGIAFIES